MNEERMTERVSESDVEGGRTVQKPCTKFLEEVKKPCALRGHWS